MSNSDFRKEIKKPDAAFSAMRSFLDVLMSNYRAVLAGVVVITLSWVGIWQWSEHKERVLDKEFGELFRVQKKYDDALKKINDDHNTQSKDEKKDSKKLEAELEIKKSALKDEFEKDLAAYADAHPQSEAGGTASLQLVAILLEKEKWAEARAIVEKLKGRFDRSSVSYVQTQMSMALIHESANEWEPALSIYRTLEKEKVAIAPSVFSMGQARCLAKLGRKDEAIKIYETIEKDEKNPFSSEARGLKRLLKRESKSS